MTKIPAIFAASKIGWRALQLSNSKTPGAGFVKPPMSIESHLYDRFIRLTVDIDAAVVFSPGGLAQEVSTYLTPFRPAATIFWKISSHRSGTGRRNVWNSPELWQ